MIPEVLNRIKNAPLFVGNHQKRERNHKNQEAQPRYLHIAQKDDPHVRKKVDFMLQAIEVAHENSEKHSYYFYQRAGLLKKQ